MKITILTGEEFNNVLYFHDQERFELVEKGPWTPGENYRARHVILKENSSGDFFMGYEAMVRESDDIWHQVINTPDKKYTMRQCEKVADIGWVTMKPEVMHG